MELYGDRVKDNAIKTFYHGVSFMYFDKFIANFCGPTSTTKQLEVATLFSDDSKGLVLELTECAGTHNHLTYFDCSLISCYGNEDEKLFFGGMYFLQFKIRLMESNEDMRYFIKALSLFNKVISGWYLRCKEMENITSTDYKIIKRLIKQKISDGMYRNKFPEYINECFQRFCQNQVQIKLNIDALMHHYNGFYEDFVEEWVTDPQGDNLRLLN